MNITSGGQSLGTETSPSTVAGHEAQFLCGTTTSSTTVGSFTQSLSGTANVSTIVGPFPQSLSGTTTSSTTVSSFTQSLSGTANVSTIVGSFPQSLSGTTNSLTIPQSLSGVTTVTSSAIADPIPQSLVGIWKAKLKSVFSKESPKPPAVRVVVHLSSDKHRPVHALALKINEELTTPQLAVEAKYTSDNESTRVQLRLTPQCPPNSRFTHITLLVGLRDQDNTVIPTNGEPRSTSDLLTTEEVTTTLTKGGQVALELKQNPGLSATVNGQETTAVTTIRPVVEVTGAPFQNKNGEWFRWMTSVPNPTNGIRCPLLFEVEMDGTLPVNAEYRLDAVYCAPRLKRASVPPQKDEVITMHLRPL